MTNASVNNHSSPEAKIALFRSLFRGRDDVYPRRFESRKTDKCGYSPACANWDRDREFLAGEIRFYSAEQKKLQKCG
jgi:hypothetical protein